MQSSRRRFARPSVVAAVSVVVLALAMPASGGAATTLGMLDPTAPNSGGCAPGKVYLQGAVDTIAFPNISYVVPAGGGVITAWSTRPDATAGQQGALKVVRNNGNNTVTVLNSSALQGLTPSTPNNFTTRISVSGGESIGYGVPAGPAQACFDTQVNANWGVLGGPDPGPGSAFTVDTNSTQRRMNLTATVEADADRDGFGDESQDRCPGITGSIEGCGPGGTTPPLDRTKPTLGGLSFSRGTFAAARSGAAFTAQRGRKRRKPPVGTKVSFNLSEAASVKFTVQRKTRGRRSSGKCRTATRRNRKKPRCTLWKGVRGSFTVTGKAGKNSFTFRGRIGGRALRTGSYRLNGVATDRAKNASVTKNKGFRIVR